MLCGPPASPTPSQVTVPVSRSSLPSQRPCASPRARSPAPAQAGPGPPHCPPGSARPSPGSALVWGRRPGVEPRPFATCVPHPHFGSLGAAELGTFDGPRRRPGREVGQGWAQCAWGSERTPGRTKECRGRGGGPGLEGRRGRGWRALSPCARGPRPGLREQEGHQFRGEQALGGRRSHKDIGLSPCKMAAFTHLSGGGGGPGQTAEGCPGSPRRPDTDARRGQRGGERPPNPARPPGRPRPSCRPASSKPRASSPGR